ncbi:MAG: septum formation initiator family protein [Pseudomonadota bacterium]
MGNRVVPAALIALLVIIHAQLWFGRGSVPAVARMTEQLNALNQQNQQALLANNQLTAEVRDLKEGLEMVEEKARLELGMVKSNEIYVHITH